MDKYSYEKLEEGRFDAHVLGAGINSEDVISTAKESKSTHPVGMLLTFIIRVVVSCLCRCF